MSLTLPLGISFYTFQAASYVIDIYRRKYEIANGLLDFATYLCMFPQLIAGPIVSFSEVKDDLHKQRKISLPKIEWGTTIFVLGLAYKVLLANKIASLWNTVMTAGVMGIHPLTAWLGSWGFSMQLFFDFFGYSLMAIGLGRILGFKFPTTSRTHTVPLPPRISGADGISHSADGSGNMSISHWVETAKGRNV